jgi:hypothetical protein
MSVSVLGQGQVWLQEPTTFRSVPFGASEKEAKQTVEIDHCFNISEVTRLCIAMFKLDGVQIDSTMLFRSDSFDIVNGHFPSGSYQKIRSVFIDKYGAPTKTEEVVLQNSAGAKLKEQRLTWEGPKISVQLDQFGFNATEGGLFSVATMKYFADEKRDWEVRRAKEKNGL